MDDKELLVMAAKAAGIEIVQWQDDCPRVMSGFPIPWNPLANDGDALRLACQLQLDLVLGHNGAAVTMAGKRMIEESCHQDSGENLACTRRVIVRAAAEIGRAMQ